MIGTLPNVIFCDFCGKHQGEVELMIAGNADGSLAICAACVDLCLELVAERRQSKQSKSEVPA